MNVLGVLRKDGRPGTLLVRRPAEARKATKKQRQRAQATVLLHFDSRAWKEEALREACAHFGTVQSLTPMTVTGPSAAKPAVQRLARVSTVAVVFKQPAAAAAMAKASVPPSQAKTIKTQHGIRTWEKRHRATTRPNVRQLQQSVDELMAAFDVAQREKHAAKAGARKVDDDGFTLVTGKRRRRRAEGDIGGAASLNTTGAKRRRKKGPMEKQNFYRFQMRESKRDQLAQLRAKFAEDKERVRRLRNANPFKPK